MKGTSVLVSDIDARFIWFEGLITPKTAVDFGRMLAKINRSSSESTPIYFYIKGVGGEINSTIAMAQYIEGSPSPVCVVAHGLVASGCFLLTQAGKSRLAMAGTKFKFHPAAMGLNKKIKFIEQRELYHVLDKAKISNAVQLSWFLRKGKPADVICRLFADVAVMGLPKAIRLNLVDHYFKEADFYKDRRIARRLIKRAKR